MGVEIERKFLVDHKQWQQLAKPAGIAYRQGYLVKDMGKTIRIRVADSAAYITLKGKATGITRSEYEYAIPVQDGIEMLDLFAGTIIEKTRYGITFKNKLWEVDVFDGDNLGLIVAEIELQQEDEQLELPPWVTVEVTDQDKYYNACLTINPFKNWM